MEITDALLTISNYNRPGTRRTRTTAIACHYIGNPGTSAKANRNWFESLSVEGPKEEAKGNKSKKASCHYIIGLQGEVLRLIPEDEISWCTNQANSYTISIESCHPDATGRFTDATYQAYVELCADLCKRWGLDPEHGGLIRHYDVTRKVCPKWFVDHTDAWERFKADVADKMRKPTSGWEKDHYGRYRYVQDDGTYAVNKWLPINHHWYLFGHDGYMLTGWQKWNTQEQTAGSGDWYFLDDTIDGPLEGACWHEREDHKGAWEIWEI